MGIFAEHRKLTCVVETFLDCLWEYSPKPPCLVHKNVSPHQGSLTHMRNETVYCHLYSEIRHL